jgi:hypothetical protein
VRGKIPNKKKEKRKKIDILNNPR